MADNIRTELARLEDMILRQNRRIQNLEGREKLREQAILELDAALREAGIDLDGVGLSLRRPEVPVPASQSADDDTTLSP